MIYPTIYEETLAGRGFGLEAARPSIELVHQLRNTKLTAPDADSHRLATRPA